jgi:hypothetical protein
MNGGAGHSFIADKGDEVSVGRAAQVADNLSVLEDRVVTGAGEDIAFSLQKAFYVYHVFGCIPQFRGAFEIVDVVSRLCSGYFQRFGLGYFQGAPFTNISKLIRTTDVLKSSGRRGGHCWSSGSKSLDDLAKKMSRHERFFLGGWTNLKQAVTMWA